MFKEVLKRECVATGIMTEKEWEDRSNNIEISFIKENKFIEKMKLDNFMNKIEIYTTASEHQGKLFSINTILKEIFRYSDEEIEEEFKKIQEEEKNPLYDKFYNADDEDGGNW